MSDQALNQRLEFADEAGARDCLHQVLHHTQQHLALFSPLLDHNLFDNADFIAQVSDILRAHRSSSLRILLLSSSAIISRGHGLIRLMQRLPSRISARQLSDERLLDCNASFLLSDRRGLWLQPELELYQGWANCHDPVANQRLLEQFELAFAQGREDPELRLLKL